MFLWSTSAAVILQPSLEHSRSSRGTCLGILGFRNNEDQHKCSLYGRVKLLGILFTWVDEHLTCGIFKYLRASVYKNAKFSAKYDGKRLRKP